MWEKIKNFFKNSETIFWARLQMLIGAILTVLTTFDFGLLNPVIPAEWLPIYVVVSGVLTEYLRRRRAEDLE